MRISDWSSDVCSSDLYMPEWDYLTSTSDDSLRNSSINGTYYSPSVNYAPPPTRTGDSYGDSPGITNAYKDGFLDRSSSNQVDVTQYSGPNYSNTNASDSFPFYTKFTVVTDTRAADVSYRSEEHTSELQSLMRLSYAVFCLKKKKQKK